MSTQRAVVAYLTDEASKIVNRAKSEGRGLTEHERKTVTDYLDRCQEIRMNEEIADSLAAGRYGTVVAGGAGASLSASSGGPGLGDHLAKSGFNLRTQPSAQFSAFTALAKAPTLPVPSDLSTAPAVLVPMGRDARWLWPNLARQNAGDNLAVSDFRQTARSVTGTVERDIDATTDKAELNVTLEHVVEELKQEAIVISDVPNAILESVSMMRDFFNAEGRFQVEKALDDHVMAQIVAATPPFGNTGTGLIAQVRNAITSMRAEGANPDLLVVNATDAATLDLSVDGAGGYVFPVRDTGSASPLWGVRVIERPGTTPPYVLDSRMLGVLYLGNMSFDADPYTGFKKNLTNLRVEVSALFHVRNAMGARRIAAT